MNDQLIELYKVTLEELRQHRAIYVQSFIGLGIGVPILLTAISFLFGYDSPIKDQHIAFTKWGIFIGVLLFICLYFWTLSRYSKRMKVCKEVLRRIEHKLSNTNLENILISRELDNIKSETCWAKIRFWIYIPMAFVALVLFWLLLFKGINIV